MLFFHINMAQVIEILPLKLILRIDILSTSWENGLRGMSQNAIDEIVSQLIGPWEIWTKI